MSKNLFLSIIVKLLLIAISLSFIWIVEVCAGWFYRAKKLDQITDVLTEDPLLFWRHKPLLRQDFHGALISTDSKGFRIVPNAPPWDSSQNRVLVMGASPCFGWGVTDNQNYTALLQDKFNGDNTKKTSFFNASQIGYSSFQGIKLFDQELIFKKPTHILVSYVINDLDYYRFYRNSLEGDKHVPNENKEFVLLRNFFSHLDTFRLLDSLFKQISGSFYDEKKNQSQFIQKSPRVTIEDYQLNLLHLVDLAKKNGIVPIFVKLLVHLPSTIKTDTDALAEKENLLSQVSKTRVMGEEEIRKLKLIESFFINKNSFLYNQVMEKISRENEIQMVDIVSVFNRTDEYLFLDPQHDTIHPNARGHQVIANAIYPFLKEIFENK